MLDSALEPQYVSIRDAAKFSAVSEWTIKNLLRQGVLEARKSGRRTLVVFESVKRHAAALPDAKFAAPRPRGSVAQVERGV
jgi:hypothetical protein